MKKKKASFLFAVLLSCSQVMGISIPVGAEEVIMEEETLETRQNTNSDGLENETETGQLEIMSLEEVPTDEVPEEVVSFPIGNIGYHMREGTHFLSRYDWRRFMEYRSMKEHIC